ncbi:Tyrosine recombinase XerC [bioreactor metagenome]|uniref:Tyrosine recombinase XerC n=1 Tax=bioreactor metagenome TaxID=1076179 RepID=A0A644WTB3_9ZZZZ
MVAGHLTEKKGLYYIVLQYPTWEGVYKHKWIPTKLHVKGNKKRAEEMLMEARRNFVPETAPVEKDMLFADFLEKWLEINKPAIQLTTYSSYSNMVKRVIGPYFRKKKITLSGLKPMDIQNYYTEELKRVKASSVLHYNVVIHKALKYAFKTDLIPSNPADKIERPRKERFTGSFYDSEEMDKLFEAVKGTRLELPVFLGAFYGLRRSEVLGLKWDAIDFSKNTLTIQHTVVECCIDGKQIFVQSDSTKTKSSMRTLPLVPQFREKLLAVKQQQEENQKLCGNSYGKDYKGYVCVNEMGDLTKPSYITDTFQKVLKRNGLRKIRFHDLRHSCASMLLRNNVPMKQIQEWLGHSDFSTTANIYAHLDYSSKISSAEALMAGVHLDGMM